MELDLAAVGKRAQGRAIFILEEEKTGNISVFCSHNVQIKPDSEDGKSWKVVVDKFKKGNLEPLS